MKLALTENAYTWHLKDQASHNPNMNGGWPHELCPVFRKIADCFYWEMESYLFESCGPQGASHASGAQQAAMKDCHDNFERQSDTDRDCIETHKENAHKI